MILTNYLNYSIFEHLDHFTDFINSNDDLSKYACMYSKYIE